MTCYGVRYGYYSRVLNPVTGKRRITFDPRKSFEAGPPIMIPCGECIGCRLNQRRQWAVRCMHEKRMWSVSSFLTLTYADKNIPEYGSLRLRDLQLFMKKLRVRRPAGLRFFACGEYGGITHRPHYHVLLFNVGFPDKRFLKVTEADCALYRSAELSSVWTFGDSFIGNVDYRSCCYVAGYVVKKVGSAPWSDSHREAEFRVMSRRPGIGASWYDANVEDAYRHDSAILDGREVPLPRYYDTKFALADAERMEAIKRCRKEKALAQPEELTKARMMTKELLELRKQEFFNVRGG